MPRGYRYAIAAALGLLSYQAIADKAHDTAPQNKHGSAHAPVAAEGPVVSPQPYQAHCDHPKDSGELGACASVVQARAAEAANRIAEDGFRLNVAGVIAVVATLIATAWAALAASQAATATKLTVKAFMAVERPHVICRLDCGNWTFSGLSMTVVLSNIGRSPGVPDRIEWSVENAPKLGADRFHRRWGSPLAVDDEKAASLDADVPDAKQAAYICGFVEYASAFKTDHRSHFCYEVRSFGWDPHSSVVMLSLYNLSIVAIPRNGWPKDT